MIEGYDGSQIFSFFQHKFDVQDKIGSGSFGDVFRVRSREDGRFYAVKKSQVAFKGRADRDRKLREVAKHQQLSKHQNLIEFHNAWEEKGFLYIQTELCEFNMSQLSEARNYYLPESTIWEFLTDILLALDHLHSSDLIHLDIKLDNIFVSNGIFKLGDFGLVLDLRRNQLTEAVEGDPKYVAPELLQGRFAKAADIYSLGICVLELAYGLDLPSSGSGWHLLRKGNIPFRQFHKSTDDPISLQLQQIISSMMHPDPEQRPTAGKLLTHPPIKSVSKKRLLMTTVIKSSIKIRTLFSQFWHFVCFTLTWILSSLKVIEAPSPTSGPPKGDPAITPLSKESSFVLTTSMLSATDQSSSDSSNGPRPDTTVKQRFVMTFLGQSIDYKC